MAAFSVHGGFSATFVSMATRGVDGRISTIRCLFKGFEHGEANVVMHSVSVQDVREEYADLELQRCRSKIREQHERFWILQHQRVGFRDVERIACARLTSAS